MKIWHDDIRMPPKPRAEWLWCRTNQEAIRALLGPSIITEISLDHDLGLHNVDPAEYEKPYELRGEGEETGLDLVKVLCLLRLVPPVVHIHSWNPSGAQAMVFHLQHHCPTPATVTVKPYVHAS